MDTISINNPPRRITDLVGLKEMGSQVSCRPTFEIVPVDFQHQDNPFQAYIFLCRYGGTVDGIDYSFRKCYARGCPNNLCPHVSQAVMIANRYLQRDYRTLRQAGIDVDNRLFSLDDMVVKFEAYREEFGPPLTIDDYVKMAREGADVNVSVTLEYIPVVEHFGHQKNPQTFLQGSFDATVGEARYHTQRCLACYPTDHEAKEKPAGVRIANERLALIYNELDRAGIHHEKKYFH